MNLLPWVVCVALAAGADSSGGDAATERGVVLEIHLGTQLTSLGFVGSVNLVEGGLFGAFKFDRFIIGLGVDGSRFSTASSTVTSLLFLPGVQVSILRSADKRAEFFAQLDLGYGALFFDSSVGRIPNSGGSQIRFQLAPGLRLWIHPQLAVNVVAGLREDAIRTSFGAGGGGSSSTELTGVFGALQFVGLFPL